MPKSKKFFLLHERRETWRVRFEKKRHAFCEKCQGETIWLTCAEAALASGSSEREIFRLAENASIHFAETGSGLLLVCDCSLETFYSNQK